jgi:integrase
MPRKATGAVLEHPGKDGRIYRSLRFSAYGKRRHQKLGPVTPAKAQAKLEEILEAVACEKWQPPVIETPEPEPDPMPTFHQYAEQWWLRAKLQLAAKTRTDYEWRLRRHLLAPGGFGEMPLDKITFNTVENYIAGKLTDGERIREAAANGKPMREEVTDSMGRTSVRPVLPLSPRAINMTVTLLGAILETAVERDLITRNPAKGKRRRVAERKPARSYLAGLAQIQALLDAAGELDGEATRERVHLERRAMLTTMICAGVRIGELCSLRWRDVDLQTGWLTIVESKTDAGTRKVKIRGGLMAELQAVRARHPGRQSAYVFPTRTGRRQYESKVRLATLGRAVTRANANLERDSRPPLPEGLTPHSLRRTFATILYALGVPLPVVKAEMGHETSAMGLDVYGQAERLDAAELERLAAWMEGVEEGDNVVSIASRRASNWQTNWQTGQNAVAGAPSGASA